jgi:TonB family protein
MFSQLPESRSVPPRRRLAIAVSALVHAAIVWEAMHGTAAARPAPRRIAETIPLYVSTRHPERTAHLVSAPDRGHAAPQFVMPSIDPVTIPLPTAPFTPALPDSWPAHPSGADATDSAATRLSGDGHGTIGQPFAAGEVDRAAAPRPGAPAPVYPPGLQAAGIEGVVAVEFVVDSAGNADMHRVRIVSSADPAFSEAVRTAIARTRYFPAQAQGRHVAQLVEQSFVFRITR